MTRVAIRTLVLLFTLGVAIPSAFAQSSDKPVDAEGHAWWHHAVFYEVYPRSFMDSNGDGVGDLNGITSKMEYLRWLGVDAIWITPCFPSPQVDFGYDISDYKAIDPVYGTLREFDQMERVGRRNHVGIVLDFVVNHTSDKHPWFLQSASSKTNPYHDWYVWRDAKDGKQLPNNWISIFGGTAWQWDPKLEQYYYHFFYPQQPDLNWRNPKVKDAMLDVTRFWYKRGVKGFRLDAVDTMFEDPKLTDNPVKPGTNALGDPIQEYKNNSKQPEVRQVLREMRSIGDPYGAVLIGETWTSDTAELKSYYDVLQMPMDLMFTQQKPLSAAVFRKHISDVVSIGEWPVWVMSNHDIKRAYSRFSDGLHDDDIAKVLAGMYLTLPGTPILYYGEEIGMANNDPTRKEDVKDPVGRIGWPKDIGRDGERTPMQWSEAPNAGFTNGVSWLPIPATYRSHNVATEQKDPNSILNFYRNLIALRKTNRALLDGNWVALNEGDANVLSYLRRYKDEAVIVVLNMSPEAQHVNLNLTQQGLGATARTLLSTQSGGATQQLGDLSMPAYTVYIGAVGK